MFKNYLQVAFRNLIRNQSYIIINTFGLGIALACCITAYLLVAFNVEFDTFHQGKVDKIFKIHTHFMEKDGRSTQGVAAPMVLAPVVASEVAGIERFSRYILGSGYMRFGDNAFSETIAFSDSAFFNMFHFPLLSGSHKEFKNKHTVFLSADYAKKFFGDEDPIGKSLVFNFPNEHEISATVGGILKKVPENSTFVFNVLMRIENYLDYNKLDIDNWGDWRDPSTFVELTSPENAEHISTQLSKYIPKRNEAKKDVVAQKYQLEHFNASFNQDQITQSYVNLKVSFVPMLVFLSMAGIILLIACFNLTNTSIALTGKRLKEVGIRKTVGAARSQIISQFLLETVITISMALIVGLLMAQVIVPAFTTMWNLKYSMRDLNGLNFFIAMVVLIFMASLLAGMYPAIFNSRFKPVSLLKGAVKINGTNGLTRTLVAIQFALSVVVLIAGVVFIQNTRFQEQTEFGYDTERIITVDIQSERDFETLKNAVAGNPKVMGVAGSDHNVGYNNYQFPVQVDTSKYEVRFMAVGKNYFELMGFTFLEGRPFNTDNNSDLEQAVVVNRAFLDKINMEDALDKTIIVHDVKRHIVGVIENHVDNLFRSKQAEPFLFYPAKPETYKTLFVKAEKTDLGEVQQFVEKTWKGLFPGKPFNSRFQSELLLSDIKRTNGNLQKIFIFLTILGGLLSASGIFSLASLNIARRTKEIGIRKALGATVSNVVGLLNREFVIILSIAVVIGSVGGFFATKALLDEIYARHVGIGYIPVAICALTIFGIGILTTSSTIIRAARSNPVDTLRNE